MRKTPIKHSVKSYLRKGKKVKNYIRGNGIKVSKHLSNPNPVKPKGYTVTLIYSNKKGDSEVQKVIATSYTRAVDEAFENKTDKRMPVEISVVDPSIGEIIHWAGANVAKAAKRAYGHSKGLYNDMKTASLERTASTSSSAFVRSLAKQRLERHREKMKRARDQSHDVAVKKLIDDSYSADDKVKLFARAKLRKEHPDVWHVMDISRS